MSWNHQNRGNSREEIVKQLRDVTEPRQMPDLVVEAIDKSLKAFGAGVEGTDREIVVTSYGHISPDGTGNASIVVNIVKKAVDATSRDGATQLAEQMKS